LTQPVKNSIRTKEGILLTGANASGKSTFLRATALSVILAQTIHTCPAQSYRATAFRVYSSMSLHDSIISGDSYYMTEIKSIQRILEQVRTAKEEGTHVLCFVDEVLRGTNTVERIAASTQILKMFAAEHAICFAATHDVELTALLAGQYHNYHFEEKIEGEDIHFPYRLLEGPATSRNAIALLKTLGYDEKIVEEAEKMAEHFLQTGIWS
jgi:DNA mismatch repair ATPase MutS